MATNGLYPGYIKIEYHTVKAPHVMTLPTRAFNSGIGTIGGYENWGGLSVPVEDMVDELVAALVPHVPVDTVFDYFTVYQIDDPVNQVALPVAGAAIAGGTGTNAAGGIDAAQATWSFRTADLGFSRIVLLDIAPSTEFRPRKPGSFTTEDTDLAAVWAGDDAAWAGRDGSQPVTLRKVVFTLNDALRRQYKFT